MIYKYIFCAENLPKFFSDTYISVGKETDTRESEILMFNEHFDWSEVWFTKMVDEAGYITIATGINTICITVLRL